MISKVVAWSRAARVSCAWAVCCLMGGSGMAAAVPWSGTHAVDVIDPQYHATAYTMNVPDGWKFAGTIARDAGCHATGPALKYTAMSSDGTAAITALPGMTWTWTTSAALRGIMESQHCPAIDIDTAASFLLNVAVPNLRPSAQVVAVLPLLPSGQAAVAAQLDTAQRQNAEMARQYGQPPQKLTASGARVRLESVRNGVAVEELVIAVVDCFEASLPSFGQAAATKRTCSSRNTVLVRTVKGHLDDLVASPQLAAFYQGMKADAAWSQRVMQDSQAAFQQAQAASNQQFQSTMQQGRDDHARLMQNNQAFQASQRARTDQVLAQDRARQAAIDASAHATALHSLDQQEFKDPSTGQIIQASNQYNHQWLSSDGSTVIQTNEHGFDPNGRVGSVGQSWTELVPK